MNKSMFREILYWFVILFFTVFIVNRFFTAESNSEVIYLIFFAGILLVSIGSRFVFELEPNKMSLIKAIRKAREKSLWWWLPFTGLAVMSAGAVAMFYIDSISTIMAMIAIFLTVVIANLTLERLNYY
jgi:hypothetical protein